MRKILITGHKGFIGQNLFSFLKEKGLDVSGYDIKDNHACDLNIKDYDAVIHLGANSSTTETNLNKILLENFLFSKALYEQCRENNILFQYASSASVYGNSHDFSEERFCKPTSPYAFSKYMFDCWISLEGSNYQGFRYFNVYGKHEDHKGNQASPVSKFYQQAKENGKIKVFAGSENYLRDFVCVEDLCKIHFDFLSKEVSGIWNIGTSKPISFLDVAKAIQKKMSCEIEEIPFPEQLKNQYQAFTCANLYNLKKHINHFNWTTVEEWVNANY